MTLTRSARKLKERLIEVPSDKIIIFNVKPTSLFHLDWYERYNPSDQPVYKSPIVPIGIVSSMRDVSSISTPSEHPRFREIKVTRKDYFMRMSPPHKVAGYMERLGKEDNHTHCILTVHDSFSGLFKFKPYVHLNAIESFEIRD